LKCGNYSYTNIPVISSGFLETGKLWEEKETRKFVRREGIFLANIESQIKNYQLRFALASFTLLGGVAIELETTWRNLF
jgi:hypothetical protein